MNTSAPLCDLDDLIISATDTNRAMVCCRRASALVRSYTLNEWLDDNSEVDCPEAVTVATASAAERIYATRDDKISQESIGPYAYTSVAGMFLSSAEQAMLDPYVSRESRMASISPPSFSTLYAYPLPYVGIDGQPDADPLPWD